MDGVVILFKSIIPVGFYCGVLLLVLCISCVSFGIVDIICKKWFGSIVLIVSFLLTLYLGISAIKINKQNTYYKATISDSVLLKDFQKKYEIISQEGEIYTLIEKESE